MGDVIDTLASAAPKSWRRSLPRCRDAWILPAKRGRDRVAGSDARSRDERRLDLSALAFAGATLRTAKRARPETAHPRLWAAFIASGDWRPMPTSSR
jgi:hypothetical protein